MGHMAAKAATTRIAARISRMSRPWMDFSIVKYRCCIALNSSWVSVAEIVRSISALQSCLMSSRRMDLTLVKFGESPLDAVDPDAQGTGRGSEDFRHLVVTDVVQEEEQDG